LAGLIPFIYSLSGGVVGPLPRTANETINAPLDVVVEAELEIWPAPLLHHAQWWQ
jgi:hypothetical protein